MIFYITHRCPQRDDWHETACGHTSVNAVINASLPLFEDEVLLSQTDDITSISVTNDLTDVLVVLGTSLGQVKKVHIHGHQSRTWVSTV